MRRLLHLSVFLFLVMPASGNFELHNYGFGAGGTSLSESGNFSVVGIAGELSGTPQTGATYDFGPGMIFAQQTNTPAVPTFTNPASYYNKLHFVLDDGDNPADTLFALAISDDSFVTTNYVQADNTVGPTAVYQTYAGWGSGSGEDVIGLSPNTTYQLKVRAIQTKYTESAWSVAASAATVGITLTYDLDVAATDTETAAPYTLAMGSLLPATVTTASQKIWVDLDTNAAAGAFVYAYNSSAGLSSAGVSYTIPSATANLASASEGFGVRVDTLTQSSGGPLAAVAPYDSAADNVGVLDTTTRTILNSSSVPITGGRASLLVKAKASTLTPTAGDYTAILTMIASATF
jgi:hypothetical protein